MVFQLFLHKHIFLKYFQRFLIFRYALFIAEVKEANANANAMPFKGGERQRKIQFIFHDSWH